MPSMPADNNSRLHILTAPTSFLELDQETISSLGDMGFTTVNQAFRAALIGRLCTRRKGGKSFQDRVLAACCRLLGHPPLCHGEIAAFTPRPDEITLADGLARINGATLSPPPHLLNQSLRDLLLPGTLHRGIISAGIKTIGELFHLPIARAREIKEVGDKHIGQILIHLFDFLLLDCPESRRESVTMKDFHRREALNHQGMALKITDDDKTAAEKADTMVCYRNLVGGLFPGQVTKEVVIAFESSRDHDQLISLHRCGICGTGKKNNDLCRHATVLAAQAMIRLKNGSPTPLPLFLTKGPFRLIVQILFELFGSGDDHGIRVENDCHGRFLFTVAGPDDHPWAAWVLNADDAGLCRQLFPEKFCPGTLVESSDHHDKAAALYQHLRRTGRTLSEISINELGRETDAQARDGSIWAFLVSRMGLLPAGGELFVDSPDPGGLCRLKFENDDHTWFSLTLPRSRTGDMLAAVYTGGHQRNILPPATRFRRLNRTPESDNARLRVILRLENGEEFDCETMAATKFGHFYHLEGHGFVMAAEAHPLPGQTPPEPRNIPLDKIPEFINNHPELITNPDNDIAPEFRKIKIVRQPDSIEFDGLSIDGGWCYISGHYGLGKRYFPLTELIRNRRNKKRYINEDDRWLDLEDSNLEWLFNLNQDRVWQNDEGKSQGIKLSLPELFFLKAQMPSISSTSGNIDLEGLLDTTSWQIDNRNLPIPQHLRGYQKRGVTWMASIRGHQLGGILADDMGLGKTHQALALMSIIKTIENGGHFLVVCPATVVSHWLEKLETFFPEISAFIYHGSRRDLKKCDGSNLLLTTYGIIRRDADLLAARDFDLIVLDEIQQLKNKNTEAYRAALKLKGGMVIGLTGTPLENSVHDLKAIFDLCLPGYLGDDRWFNQRFAVPIAAGDKQRRLELRRMITPFILRRSREQVLTELPEIIEDERTCELSDDQISLYREIVASRGRPLLDRINREKDKTLPYMELLAVINYLKQVCNHPCLLQECDTPEQYSSGKWDLFCELLSECLEARMKVVVFSHYTRMLDLIETHLNKNNIDFCGLRGEMSIKTRQTMISRFNNDPECQVFSASLLAGGVGVDLTAAQAVIHYDRWWNAAREDQATARVHRMGQKKVVQVFKLVTIGTLEEKINHLINHKRELARTIIQEDDDAIVKQIDRNEIISLLSPLTE